jgi:hypothetical protein
LNVDSAIALIPYIDAIQSDTATAGLWQNALGPTIQKDIRPTLAAHWLRWRQSNVKGGEKMLLILLVIVLLLSIGSFPSWPYSRGWGYYPSGGLGLVLVILLILIIMGRF